VTTVSLDYQFTSILDLCSSYQPFLPRGGLRMDWTTAVKLKLLFFLIADVIHLEIVHRLFVDIKKAPQQFATTLLHNHCERRKIIRGD